MLVVQKLMHITADDKNTSVSVFKHFANHISMISHMTCSQVQFRPDRILLFKLKVCALCVNLKMLTISSMVTFMMTVLSVCCQRLL